MRGQPITSYEREKIELFLRGWWSLRKIARYLHRDHSVIVREIARNRDRQGVYRAASAHEVAVKRLSREHRHKLDEDDVLRNYVMQKLKEGWSPQKIAGRLKNHPDSQVAGSYVCHETIYQYTYEGAGRFLGLYQYLVRKHKKRHRKFGRKPRKEKGISFMTSIHQRPKEITQRLEFGHWESDSIVSKESKAALNVLRELKSHKLFITYLPNMSAQMTEEAIRQRIQELGSEHFQSITFDRGSEGANHYKLRLDYNIDTYHCDPYCSHQKGAVENSNGLIRRFFPKGTDFLLVTPQQIYDVQNKLDNQPRAQLGYKTPHEISGALMG
ncbi:IS30 family transposase [Candidatus Uhrbacteria bacterium]|nr:IS30 family transposase [Candidatus Uhrbacteria bacterium]